MSDQAMPIACTLVPDRRSERIDEFHRLFAGHLLALKRTPRPLRLILDAGNGVEPAARSLLARERECCAFFAFTIAAADGELLIDAKIPAGAETALDSLEHLAGQAAPRAARQTSQPPRCCR